MYQSTVNHYPYDRYYGEHDAAADVRPEAAVPAAAGQQHDVARRSLLEPTWQPHTDYAPHEHALEAEDAYDEAILEAAAESHPVIDATLKQHQENEPNPPRQSQPQQQSQPHAAGFIDSTYVLRIHEMLEDSEKEGHQDIVSWQPHGRAFKIHNEEKFVAEIMPRYFKARYSNFRRWLRAWGFFRMTEGKDRGSWYHRYFVRGVTNLCRNMTRQQMFQAMIDWLPAGQIPDFYSASTSDALSEIPRRKNAKDVSSKSPVGLVQNPRRLRGTILEDVRAMLQDMEDENNEHIVSWLPHGKAFKIHNRVAFQTDIMPRYFKTDKVNHLSDTLRIWGFRRLKKHTGEKGAFYHRLFVRGQPALCRHRSRQKMKEAMAGWEEYNPGKNEPQAQAPYATQRNSNVSHTTTASLPADAEQAIQAAGSSDPLLFTTAVLENDFQTQQDGAPTQPLEATGDKESSEHTQAPHPDQTAAVHGASPPMPTQETGQIAPANQTLATPQHSKGSKGGDLTYVLRIHEMLEDAEREGNRSIVSWQPHGRAFRIHNESKFVSDIMPRYFKAKIGSFRRWLRAWGFCRMTEGLDRGAWYHRYFVRGVTSLCGNMSRQDMFRAMVDWLPAGQVPDFYSPGTGLVFSEKATPTPGRQDSSSGYAKNPKQLRGTMLEDLRAMLDDAEREGNQHIVSWLPHGRAFKVHNKVAFAKQIMPRYFRATKATYLSDTLRMWGFARLKQGANKRAYFHRLFVKGRPELTRHVPRQQMRDAMAGWPLPVEPDLYAPDIDQVIEQGLQANTAPKRDTEEPEQAPGQEGQAMTTALLEGKPTDIRAGEKRKRDTCESVATA